jgi:hypothetical protein
VFFCITHRSRFFLERRQRYGNIFSAAIDFSGSWLRACRVVCYFSRIDHGSFYVNNQHENDKVTSDCGLFYHSFHTQFKIPAGNFTYLGYSGLHGPHGFPEVDHIHNKKVYSKESSSQPDACNQDVDYCCASPSLRYEDGVPVPVPAAETPPCHALPPALSALLPRLSQRVLHKLSCTDHWEDTASLIIQKFLQRLAYECRFSFADRIKE